MKTNSILCCAMALAAFAACGGNGTTTTTGTSGSTSGATTTTGSTTTSGSTTGGTCAALAASCASKNCCSGLACDSASKICKTPSGTTSGTTGSANPCTPAAAGGACATSLDCATGLLCFPDGGGNSCQAPTAGVTKCTAKGFAPSASTGPCCESEIDAGGVPSCGSWVTCALPGNACTATADCCADGRGYPVTCTGGKCTSCGLQGATCASNSDCCGAGGFQCLPNALLGGATGSSCQNGLDAQFTDGGQFIACSGQPFCSANPAAANQLECQSGALCIIDVDAGDPCAPLGLVCDTTFTGGTAATYGVCDSPTQNATCIPGGPACNGNAFSVAPSDCFTLVGTAVGTVNICEEPCDTNQDCSNYLSFCYTGFPGLGFCQPTTGSCTTNGAPCKITVANDGICGIINFPGTGTGTGAQGICFQAAADGGGPGAACNISGNRQIGQLCDNKDFCQSGVCGPVCNAGTGTAMACPAGQDCVPALGIYQSTDAVDMGACVTPCGLTADGGSCLNSAAGVPQKCIPSELLGFTWAAAPGHGANPTSPDFCGYLSSNAIPLGGDCTNAVSDDSLDPCVAGALCVGVAGSPSICTQICTDSQITQTGPAGGCPAGQQCQGLNFGAGASTHLGVCSGPSGGTTTTSSSGGTTSGTTSGTTTGGATTGTTGGTTSGTTTGTTSSSSTTG